MSVSNSASISILLKAMQGVQTMQIAQSVQVEQGVGGVGGVGGVQADQGREIMQRKEGNSQGIEMERVLYIKSCEQNLVLFVTNNHLTFLWSNILHKFIFYNSTSIISPFSISSVYYHINVTNESYFRSISSIKALAIKRHLCSTASAVRQNL